MCGSRGWIPAASIPAIIRYGIPITAAPPTAAQPGPGSREFRVMCPDIVIFAPKASAFPSGITSPSASITRAGPKPYGAKARTSARQARSGTATGGKPSPNCPIFGATSPSKKTLVFAQNLENKGPEIFLPPRSMVLKVVRGKILETLELRWFPAARSSVLGTALGAAKAIVSAMIGRPEPFGVVLTSGCQRS